jgi:hypothetical protein
MDGLLREVRAYIYHQLVDTSAAPSTADTAHALGRPAAEIDAAYGALADADAIILRPGSTTIWMALPFSNMQTAFTVIVDGRAYYANCAWDAFGIPAALGTDARIFTTCPDCGGVLERKIMDGALTDTRGAVHIALPARRWWEDVGSWCTMTLLFGSESHVDRWCEKQQMPRGAVLTLDQAWALAREWYGGRLDPDWRRRTPAENTAVFASVGLTGDFWTLP